LLAMFVASVAWKAIGTPFCSTPMNTGAKANAGEVLSMKATFPHAT
jgi:hypothetical protein